MITMKKIVKKVKKIEKLNKKQRVEVIKNARKEIRRYVKENNLKSLVIGISGGLDSAVVAALCQSKYTGVPLIGLSIPMDSSKEHREQAIRIGEKYCDGFEEFVYWGTTGYMKHFEANEDCIDTNKIMNIIFKNLETNDRLLKKAGISIKKEYSKVLKGNMKARMRMITLYDMARRSEGMVLSTDNLSEYLMGFWTINGDVGDFGPIQNIGKGFELPQIAKELGVPKDIIKQKPSDGLMVTEDNTDEAQLGANYKEVDTIMGIYLKTLKCKNVKTIKLRKKMLSMKENNKEDFKKVEKVINRYKNLEFKRRGTINLTRKQLGLI